MILRRIHAAVAGLVPILVFALALTALGLVLTGCGGGGGGASAAAPAAPSRAVTTWHDAARLRPASAGAIAVDANGVDLVGADGQPVKVGEWTSYFDADGSPVQRVERFDGSGRSLGWTTYNADTVDPVTRRGSVRDDSGDALQR